MNIEPIYEVILARRMDANIRFTKNIDKLIETLGSSSLDTWEDRPYWVRQLTNMKESHTRRPMKNIRRHFRRLLENIEISYDTRTCS
jgi:hypothetical protein